MIALREFWKLKIGKFLIMWLIGIIIFSVFLWIIDDIYLKIALYFIGFSIFSIPIWVSVGVSLKKRKRIKINGKFVFKCGRIFEYIFILFLFCATFFLTYYSVYLNNIQNSSDFFYFFSAGIGLMFFLVNAIISGYFHYVLGFHD